jgi:hypothetical protein
MEGWMLPLPPQVSNAKQIQELMLQLTGEEEEELH